MKCSARENVSWTLLTRIVFAISNLENSSSVHCIPYTHHLRIRSWLDLQLTQYFAYFRESDRFWSSFFITSKVYRLEIQFNGNFATNMWIHPTIHTCICYSSNQMFNMLNKIRNLYIIAIMSALSLLNDIDVIRAIITKIAASHLLHKRYYCCLFWKFNNLNIFSFTRKLCQQLQRSCVTFPVTNHWRKCSPRRSHRNKRLLRLSVKAMAQPKLERSPLTW